MTEDITEQETTKTTEQKPQNKIIEEVKTMSQDERENYENRLEKYSNRYRNRRPIILEKVVEKEEPKIEKKTKKSYVPKIILIGSIIVG